MQGQLRSATLAPLLSDPLLSGVSIYRWFKAPDSGLQSLVGGV